MTRLAGSPSLGSTMVRSWVDAMLRACKLTVDPWITHLPPPLTVCASLLNTVCMDRRVGSIAGYYYDPNSAPFQFLQLQSVPSGGTVNHEGAGGEAGSGGLSFGSYAIR